MNNDAIQTQISGPDERPVYKTNIINGLPVLRFDGTDDHYIVPSLSGFNSQNVSAFVVIRPTAVGGGSGADIVGKVQNGGASPYASFGSQLTTSWSIYGNEGGSFNNTVASGSASIGSSTILSQMYGTSITLYEAGSQIANRNKVGSFAYDTGNVFIGSFPPSVSGNTLTGDLAEVLLYDRFLSTDERQLVEGSLAWKYGLESLLPGDHPFRFLNPNFIAVPEPSAIALVGGVLLLVGPTRRRRATW